jgi:hypothetical protein
MIDTPAPSRAGEAAGTAPPRLWLTLVLALVAAKLAVHLLLSNRPGYFRDELYFLDCARHLDWGYVDCAPLVALYAKVALLLGGSLPALQLIGALGGAATIVVTVLLAWRLGGGRFAQGLAGLAALVVPVYLAIGSILSMNAFEPLFWMGCAYVLVRLVQTGDSRLWLAFGLLAGLGLMNKHSTLFFGAAVAIAVILTPLRRELRRPWIWLGALVALAVFTPNLVWQWQHGFPTLEDLRNVRESGKNVVLAPLAFVAEQTVLMHPVLLPLWLGGLWSLLAGRLRRYRALGITFVAVLVIMFALRGKSYYLAPAYPMLLAAGAVAFDGWLERRAWARARAWPRAVVLAVVVAAGAVTAPLVLTILGPEQYLDYQDRLGVGPSKTEVDHEGPLPQLYGDQFGWPEFVATVARIYHALPEQERAKACILASNYGEAGAINLFGPAHGLPPAISGHQTHSFWGWGDCTGEVLIWTQAKYWDLDEFCGSVEIAGEHHHLWGMAEEDGPIAVCRDLKLPMAELWPEIRHWN